MIMGWQVKGSYQEMTLVEMVEGGLLKLDT